MDVDELTGKIIDLINKDGPQSTNQIEEKLATGDLEECSDKIVYALIRLKNDEKIVNEFKGKTNIWSLR